MIADKLKISFLFLPCFHCCFMLALPLCNYLACFGADLCLVLRAYQQALISSAKECQSYKSQIPTC